MDSKVLMDKQSASEYAAKYATKSEKQQPDFPDLLASIVESVDAEIPAQSACQKLLNKMLGE